MEQSEVSQVSKEVGHCGFENGALASSGEGRVLFSRACFCGPIAVREDVALQTIEWPSHERLEPSGAVLPRGRRAAVGPRRVRLGKTDVSVPIGFREASPE